MDELVQYAFSMVGTPYKYGGNNPILGIDCSGYVCELMKAAGELAWNEDLSAQGLFDRFEKNTTHGLFTRGCLAFYGQSLSSISHVAFMPNSFNILEAGGGDHLTLTREDAAAKNAFVRMRLVHTRKDFLVTLKPRYARIGVLQP